MVSPLSSLCDEGDLTASVCLDVPPIPSLPLWVVLRILVGSLMISEDG